LYFAKTEKKELVEFGEADHVHLLVDLSLTLLFLTRNTLKTISSRLIRKEFEQHKQFYWKPILDLVRTVLYLSGGALPDILKYIQKSRNT